MSRKLSFEKVCSLYEFATWELEDAVQSGTMKPTAGKFTVAAVESYFQQTPDRIFSLRVAGLLYGKSGSVLRRQALNGKLNARKIDRVWATTTEWMDQYIRRHGRYHPAPLDSVH